MLLSYEDEELIRRITIGCEKFVYNMEDERLTRKFKPRKPSQRQRIQLSVLFPALSEPYKNKGFRPFPTIKERLQEIELVCKPLTYSSLKALLNVNYLQKLTLKERSEYSAMNVVYRESRYVCALKELISKNIPRTIIFYRLLQSNILLRYLTILKYSDLLMRKYIDVDEVLKARRARGLIDQQKQIELFRRGYTIDQNFLHDKTNRQILYNAERFAMEELKIKSLDDPIFTRFFIAGGISYGEIELELNYTRTGKAT